MQSPHPTASTELHLDASLYAQSTCQAFATSNTLTGDALATVQAAASELEAVNNRLIDVDIKLQATSRTVRMARAALLINDGIVDATIMQLADTLRNMHCGRDRNHPDYVHVFGGSRASKLTRIHREEQPEAVDQMLLRLDSIPDFTGKAEAKMAVVNANALVKARRDAFRAATAEEQTRLDDSRSARQAVRESLSRQYGNLQAAFPRRMDFIESFFLRRKAKKGETVEIPAEAEAPTNGVSDAPVEAESAPGLA